MDGHMVVEAWHLLVGGITFVSALLLLWQRITSKINEVTAWRTNIDRNDEDHNKRLERLEKTIQGNGSGGMRDQLTNIQHTLDSINGRLDSIDRRIDSIDDRLTKVEDSLNEHRSRCESRHSNR